MSGARGRKGLTRRNFLKTTGAAGVAACLSAVGTNWRLSLKSSMTMSVLATKSIFAASCAVRIAWVRAVGSLMCATVRW